MPVQRSDLQKKDLRGYPYACTSALLGTYFQQLDPRRRRRAMNSAEQNNPFQEMPYEQYLQTPQWRARRNRALSQARHRCHRCGANRRLQVHHLTYERLGAELDSDLEVLCRGCHLGEHANEAGTGLGIYVKVISDVLKEKPFEMYASW
jgi:hypothetical protein